MKGDFAFLWGLLIKARVCATHHPKTQALPDKKTKKKSFFFGPFFWFLGKVTSVGIDLASVLYTKEFYVFFFPYNKCR